MEYIDSLELSLLLYLIQIEMLYAYQRGVSCFSKGELKKSTAYFLEASITAFHPKACFRLYFCYYKGIGLRKNNKKATFWLKQSIKQGFKSAITYKNRQLPDELKRYF